MAAFKVIALIFAAATTFALCSATPVNQDYFGFNELLNAKDMFSEQADFSQYKVGAADFESKIVLESLKGLLNEGHILDDLYSRYKVKYGKENNLDAVEGNKETFKSQLVEVARHNLEARRGLHTWDKGVNQFTDIPEATLKSLYNGYRPNLLASAFENSSLPQTEQILSPKAPASVDWKAANRCGAVKDQGNCNSCVMYASSAVVESAVAVKGKRAVVELSPQQLLDCAQPAKDICKTGSMDDPVLDYIKKTGLVTLAKYPIRSDKQKAACQTANTSSGTKIKSWSGNVGESKLKDAVALAPISTGVTGPPFDFQGGIYDGCKKSESVNHAILVAGYGTANKVDFWLIKNSYGTSWGESGYYRLKRGTGSCKIGTDRNISVNL